MQYATEMAKIWAREDKQEYNPPYPAILDPHYFEHHKGPYNPNGTPKCLQQRLSGMFGYEVKLIMPNGKKFVGHMHKNGRGNGLVVINRKGRMRMFDYGEITRIKWNDMPSGHKRMEITYDE